MPRRPPTADTGTSSVRGGWPHQLTLGYWQRVRRYGRRNLCPLCGGVATHGHHGRAPDGMPYLGCR